MLRLLAWLLPGLPGLAGQAGTVEVGRLAAEVGGRGWIVFSARSERGDWDLVAMRPDGSRRRAVTDTPDWHEFYPLFSRDGSRLLFRRLARAETIDGNRYGEQGSPVVARADGTEPRVLGGAGALPWASWSPTGDEFACLSVKGVSIVGVADGAVRRTIPRRGFFQQLTWSPDGAWLGGVANSFGTTWTVARMPAAGGDPTAVSREDNCTPDWFPDSRRLVFSNRSPALRKAGEYGWTQLWMADADGANPRLLYAEEGRHIYGGHVSPDGRYVVFTGNPVEDGDPQHRGAPMSVMRIADAPLIVGRCEEVRKKHPGARSGPVRTSIRRCRGRCGSA